MLLSLRGFEANCLRARCSTGQQPRDFSVNPKLTPSGIVDFAADLRHNHDVQRRTALRG